MSNESPAFRTPHLNGISIGDNQSRLTLETIGVSCVPEIPEDQFVGVVEFVDSSNETARGNRSSGLLDFLFKKSVSAPKYSQRQLLRRRASDLRWACPTCAHVNASDANSTCAQCHESFPSLLIDPKCVSLPPNKRVTSYRSLRNSAGGVAAGALLGPLGLATAAAAAAGANIANIRFTEAIRCEEVRLQVRALVAADPKRDVRAVLRCGGGLGPDEVKFLAARDVHVAAHIPVFLDLERDVSSSQPKEAPLRIAVAVSGGGLRAMMCHLAAMQVAKNSGLLDCSTYIAGLSGSCWSLGAWYADAVKLMQQQRDSGVLPATTPPKDGAGAELDQEKVSTQYSRETTFVALDMTVENIRSRIHHDLRYPPAAWLGNCRKEWIAARFAARKAQGLDLSSSDLFGGNIANYLLGDQDSRGTTLSDQRAVFASGAMPMPIYTCVRKDVESEVAQDDWMPDDASNVCLICGVEWSHFAGIFAPSSQSRHHCRCCGRLVCGACSTNRAVIGGENAIKPPTDVGAASHEEVIGNTVASATSIGGPAASAVAESTVPTTETHKELVRVCDDCYREKRYETSKKKNAKNWWMWWEFNPFEVGALSPSSFRSGDFVVAKPPHRKDEDVQDGNLVAPTKRSTSKRSAMSNGSSSSSSSSSNSSNNAHNAIALGPACPAWAFGRVFHDGVCLGVAPGGEQSLGLLLGVFGAAFNATWEHVYDQIAPSLPQAFSATLHSWADKYHGGHLVAPAVFHDFRRISPRMPRVSSLRAEEDEEAEQPWTCSTCSFANNSLLPACEMCHAPMPSPPTLPHASQALPVPQNLNTGASEASSEPSLTLESARTGTATASASPLAPAPRTEGNDDKEEEEEVPPLLPLTDAGLDFNFPIIPLLRPERAVDVLLVLDYSQYDPKFTRSNEWAKAIEYCLRNHVPLPQSFDAGAVAAAPLTVFPSDGQGAPTLIVLHTNVVDASQPSVTTSDEGPNGSDKGAAAATAAASDSSGTGTSAAAAAVASAEAKTKKKAFAPLENAKNGGYCDLSTLKYSKAQFDELFGFGVEHFERALPQIKAALRDAAEMKKEKQKKTEERQR